jgi:hypothetical protein
MIAETANLTTARNVVKEAASDHNGNSRKVIQETVQMSWKLT